MNQLVPSQQPSSSSGSDRWMFSTQPQPSSQEQGGAPVDLARLVTALRRRWWLVAFFTISVGAVAWYQVRHQPRIYRASAVVQLVDARDNLTDGLVKSNTDRI